MRKVQVFLFYFILAIISVAFYFFLSVALNGESINVLTVNQKFTVTHLVVGLATSIIVSISEEVIFRGILINYLLKWVNEQSALVCQSILFALIHLLSTWTLGNINVMILMIYFVNMLAGGLLLGLIYCREGMLLASISFHLAWNFTAYNLLGLSNQPSIIKIVARRNVFYGIFEKDLLTLSVFITLFAFLRTKNLKCILVT